MAIQTVLLHPHLSRRSDNSTSHLNMDLKNAWFTFTFYGWKMFQPDLKSKLLQPFGIATYFAIKTRVVFTTRLLATTKNVLPAHHYNDIIYQFVCHCNSRYIGPTSQRLQERIKQHVLRLISKHHSSQDRCNFSRPARQMASFKLLPMTLLLDSIFCKTLPVSANTVMPSSLYLSEDVLYCTVNTFHLSALEATFIKSFQPNQCQYKEFIAKNSFANTFFSFASDWLFSQPIK